MFAICKTDVEISISISNQQCFTHRIQTNNGCFFIYISVIAGTIAIGGDIVSYMYLWRTIDVLVKFRKRPSLTISGLHFTRYFFIIVFRKVGDQQDEENARGGFCGMLSRN